MNLDDYEGHTPGPWKLVNGDPYDDEADWLDIVSEHGNGFEVQKCVGFSDGGEGDPNVKLMVAAPDLLKYALDIESKLRQETNQAADMAETLSNLGYKWCDACGGHYDDEEYHKNEDCSQRQD